MSQVAIYHAKNQRDSSVSLGSSEWLFFAQVVDTLLFALTFLLVEALAQWRDPEVAFRVQFSTIVRKF